MIHRGIILKDMETEVSVQHQQVWVLTMRNHRWTASLVPSQCQAPCLAQLDGCLACHKSQLWHAEVRLVPLWHSINAPGIASSLLGFTLSSCRNLIRSTGSLGAQGSLANSLQPRYQELEPAPSEPKSARRSPLIRGAQLLSPAGLLRWAEEREKL